MALLCVVSTPIWATDITVGLGEDIQQAINTVASSGGGVVTVAAGTHIVTTPLRIKSNITLQGEGNWASKIKTNTNIQVINADAEGLVNIVIQNIEIEGVNGVNGGGIQITSQGVDHDNIQLLNVHCYNTGWGVHIKGAKNLLIKDCLFEGNGAVTKEGYAHNLYLRRVYGAEVRDSKFLNSISANGINISYSEDIEIYNCEMSGNYFRGVRAANTDGYLVHDCIVKDNGDVGILANSEGVATTNIDIRRNCVSNNALEGIKGVNGVTGVAYHNNAYGNGTDYSLPGLVTQVANNSDVNLACVYSTVPTIGLSAIKAGGQVSLNWGLKNIEAVKQDVFRNTVSSTSGRQLIASNVNGAHFTDNTAVQGNTYWYWIKVTDGLGVSYNSNAASPEPEPIEPLVMLTTTAGNGFVTLNWELQGINLGTSGIQGVFRKKASDTGGRTLLVNRVPGTTYTDNTAENGVTYLYYVKVTDENAVDHNSEAIEATPSATLSNVSLKEEDNSKIMMYPNPASNQLTIINALNAQLELYDSLGRKVGSQEILSNNQTIDISFLPVQLYVVKLKNKGDISSFKFLKR
ncbi:T9SS type A sorting domain-containing protein [Mariniflexile ostreae]